MVHVSPNYPAPESMSNSVRTASQEPAKTLLLVDDMPENLSLLGQILMPHYQVRVASSGKRALQAAATLPRPDLVLLDIMMPEMDGYEVLQRLRADPATRDIPVIFVTALTEAEDEARGFSLGVVDYITKPVRPTIVLARVKTQLELKDVRDRLQDRHILLEQEVERRQQQNQMIQDVTLRALASIAETRNSETTAHLLRTRQFVRILAEELAQSPVYAATLTPAMIENIAKAAPLHDIGKVGIPDHLVNLQGKHTPQEWAVMQTHTKLGADAIKRAVCGEDDRDALDFLYIAMDIAQCHHEKWDGSGYPAGLQGTEIPLTARLMALADVFDALTHKRCWRNAFSFEESVKTVFDSSGSHFEPAIVDAFMRRCGDFIEVAKRYPDPELAA